jgi:hypothetical protein
MPVTGKTLPILFNAEGCIPITPTNLKVNINNNSIVMNSTLSKLTLNDTNKELYVVI